jgi:acyl-CoA synthetase (AMP-forming)/AMP-acid ligase II
MSEIVERFSRMCRNAPGRCLVHLPAARVSLTTAHIRAAYLGQRTRLDALGLGSDNLLVCAAGNHAAVLPLWLACRSLSVALMPIDGGTPAVEVAALARRFGATVAIVREQAPGAEALVDLEPFAEGLVVARIAGSEPAPHLYGGAAALKLTSGSTGLPKATFTTESQLVLDALHIAEAMDIRPHDCQIAAIPISHAYGIGSLVLPLLLQGTAFVLRDGFVPHQFHSDASTYGVRVFPGVPFMFEHFVGHLPRDHWPGTVETLISAGARLEPSTAHGFHSTFGIKIHSFYGTSETGGISYDDSQEFTGDMTVGRAIPGVRITLQPEEGAPPGGGRVHVAGEAVSSGYVGERPDHDAFTGDGFLTGDFGVFDAQQRLTLTGRASSFINVAGRKVQPDEVEQVLRTMPGIIDVRVLGAPDATRGQQIVACIVTSRRDANVLAVRQFCAGRLASHKIPRTVVRLEQIPLTERGKTDRAALELLVLKHLGQPAEDRV